MHFVDEWAYMFNLALILNLFLVHVTIILFWVSAWFLKDKDNLVDKT